MLVRLRPTKAIFSAAILAAVGSMISASQVIAYSGQELARQAKIDLATARATALKTRPGKVSKEELEKEPGGSGLRYSFVIRNGSRAYEVGIDARTGAVLENIVEGRSSD
jgi:uncharacterized membrane protein YkoI